MASLLLSPHKGRLSGLPSLPACLPSEGLRPTQLEGKACFSSLPSRTQCLHFSHPLACSPLQVLGLQKTIFFLFFLLAQEASPISVSSPSKPSSIHTHFLWEVFPDEPPVTLKSALQHPSVEPCGTLKCTQDYFVPVAIIL